MRNHSNKTMPLVCRLFVILASLTTGCGDADVSSGFGVFSLDGTVPENPSDSHIREVDVNFSVPDQGLEGLDADTIGDGDRLADMSDLGLVETDLGAMGTPDVGVVNEDSALDRRDMTVSLDVMPPSDMEVQEPSAPLRFEDFDTVVDLASGDQRVWAYLITVDKQIETQRFVQHDYAGTGRDIDFWPASTIKMYAATAGLVLLTELGFSIDSQATFYRQTNGQWVEDITLSMRDIVHRTFNCSSNETYTLLLRFAGLDWLNQTFFSAEYGFLDTALMRGYVTADARPYSFIQSEPQRIVLTEGSRTVTREHVWSGRSYANERGCTVYNAGGTANCTSTRDMAEHLRRIIFHEQIPLSERFDIAASILNWYRDGGPEMVLNNIAGDDCGGPAYEGVARVFPDVIFHHKEGLVTEFRSSVMHVHDAVSDTEYVVAVAIDSSGEAPLRRVSEEIARMTKTPGLYVHLDYLRDYVNPIRAELVVVSDETAVLELITKPYAEDADSPNGWTVVEGTQTEVPMGQSAHSLRSICLSASEQVHIRGRLRTTSGRIAYSDLHYVIVDHTVNCAN